MLNWSYIMAFANMFYGSCTGKFNSVECEAYLARANGIVGIGRVR